MKHPTHTGYSVSSAIRFLKPRQLSTLAAILIIVFGLAYSFSKETPMGSISGKVRAQESNRPLPKTRVRLQPVNHNSGEIDDLPEPRSVRCDANGEFHIGQLPAGDYQISASSRAHSVSDWNVTVTEGGQTSVLLSIARSEEPLQVKEHLRVFTTLEAPKLAVSGYADEKQPAGKDSMQVRIWKTRLSSVVSKTGGLQALKEMTGTAAASPIKPFLLESATGESSELMLDRAISIKEDIEGFFYQHLDLARLASKSLPKGLYLCEIKHSQETVSTWLQVSDMALVVKRSKDQKLVYTADLQTGIPRSGSLIRSYLNGTAVAETKTDSSGIAEMTNITKTYSAGIGQSRDKQAIMLAVDGDDEALVNRTEYSEENAGSTRVHSYTDRPIYRPGQRIQFKSIVREVSEGTGDVQSRYAAKQGQPVDVALRDPSGEQIYKQHLLTNRHGSIFGSIDLNSEAPTGVYVLHVSVDGEEHTHDITIASYKKPEFAVTVTPDKPRYLKGDSVSMTVSGQYFFGAPVAGAKVSYSVYRSPNWNDSSADESDNGDSYDEESSGRRGEYGGESVAQGETRLDASGKADISFSSVPTLNASDPKFPYGAGGEDGRDETFTTSVTVTEGEHRESIAEGKALVTPGDFKLSARFDGYVGAPGQPSTLSLKASDYIGKSVHLASVEVESGYETWQDSGTQFKRISLQTVALNSAAPVIIPFAPPHAGEYVVKVRVHDAGGHIISGRASLYVVSKGGDNLNTTYTSLSILTDKRNYKSGDTARLLVNTAHTGQTVLITIEGEKIFHRQTLAIKQQSSIVSIPIRQEYGPNIFISACYIMNKHFAQSQTPLRVSAPQREMKVEITTESEPVGAFSTTLARYEPRQQITYHIRTSDLKGKGLPAELSFGVVDESIYALKEDSPHALQDDFYPRRVNEVSTDYSFAEVYLGDADKSEPKITARKKFPDTAYWNPEIQTDSLGNATVSFELPDNLTTWRATATAHSLDTKIGRAVNRIVVSKFFLVRLETPRFLTQLDETRLSAFVHNETSQPITASVGLSADNLKVNGPSIQQVLVEPFKMMQVTWPVRAENIGDAKLTVKAWTSKTAGGMQSTDGVETTLPIRPHGREIVTGHSGELTAANPENEVMRLDPKSVPSLSKLTVRITPSISSSLLGATDYLVGYPYGCTEQTMSRFLPDILVHRALRLHGISPSATTAQLPKMVENGLQRLYRFQHGSGGWGWWEADADSPWMTAYVLYGLASAKSEGYSIRENALKNGAKAALKMARDVNTDLSDRAFLIYALALLGDKANARAERHRPIELSRFSSEALGYMLLTDRLLGETDTAVIEALSKKGIAHDGSLHWVSTVRSNARDWDSIETTSTALRSMIALNRQDARIGQVLKWMMIQRTGDYWSSTRDTSWVLAAFCDYLASQPGYSASGEVRIKLNGKTVQAYKLNPDLTREREIALRIPVAQLRPNKNDVTLERVGGSSPVFYSVDLRQTVTGDNLPAISTDHLSVKREYLRQIPKKLHGDYWTLDTEPTNNQLTAGDNIQVKLTIQVPKEMNYVLVEDAYPSGCAIEDRGDADSVADSQYEWSSVDVRDDRIAFFVRTLSPGVHVITYNLRAQTPGSFRALPTLVQAMYTPESRAQAEEARISIH